MHRGCLHSAICGDPHTVVLSMLLAAFPVLFCCLPVLPSHVPPLSLCFPSALLQVILLKTCLFLDVFVFADLMPKAHEWRSARIFSMSTDPKTQQRGHLGSFEMSLFFPVEHTQVGADNKLHFFLVPSKADTVIFPSTSFPVLLLKHSKPLKHFRD